MVAMWSARGSHLSYIASELGWIKWDVSRSFTGDRTTTVPDQIRIRLLVRRTLSCCFFFPSSFLSPQSPVQLDSLKSLERKHFICGGSIPFALCFHGHVTNNVIYLVWASGSFRPPTMSFTPQRAGPSKAAAVSTPTAATGQKSVSTPTSQWSSASPQTIHPARASSALLPSPPKDSSPRSRWTEHIIPEGEEVGVKKSQSDLGISEPLARMGRSSLPAPFDLTDPRDDEQDDTVRPGVGRQATNRAVRIIQQPPTTSYLQVPAQSYSQPESRGTTPMPMRPSSQLGLITYGGRPRVPKFKAPGLDLKLTRDPSLWSYLVWRIGLPIQLFAPILIQLFLDFCSVYVVVQYVLVSSASLS